MSADFEASKRFNVLWDVATEVTGRVIPTVEEPYVEGSLRPETKSLCAEIGGSLIHVTNGEAAFADKQQVLAKLTALEQLVA